jgi:PilZ domain
MKPPEKRREPRREASGVVHVRLSDPKVLDIEGRLIDLSPGGFRMAHHFASLAAGQVVEFSHIEAKGRARVIWNRILAERVETGFLVVR